MSNVKCTPLQWEYDDGFIYGPDSEVITEFTNWKQNKGEVLTEQDLANAELIVRAVNSHDEMLGALKGLVEQIEIMYGDLVKEINFKQVTAARTAITNAERK
jgi:hypothetical protein